MSEEQEKQEIGDNTAEKQPSSHLDQFKWKPGQSGNPAGRPKGSISIKDTIRKFLEDNPEEFEKLVKYYLTNDKHRDLLWKMLDGLPKQSVDLETNGPLEIIIKKAGENENNNPPT